ncbi:MAG: cell division topological specificity factor MinE [Mariprofundaceae bacterium]|nr:cell division topological specificity factor MinE [Mariprofundaceae bacterium]
MDYFRRRKKTNSATLAKERLKIVLTHERSDNASYEPDYLPALRQELLEVISKHAGIDLNQLSVKLDRKPDKEVLEVNVILPRR